MKPIRSRRELNEGRRTLHELRRQMAILRNTYRQDKEAYRTATAGIRQLIRETRRAIATYEQAQASQLPEAIGARNPDTGELELPRLLRLLRQSAQLGQTELAERLGTKQANISRWEREGYVGYNLQQLQRIAGVLGYDVDVTFVRRRSAKGEAQ